MRFKVIRDGIEYVGENAFALTRIAEDGNLGILAQPSGLSLFTRWLSAEYGLNEQDSVGISLEKFFSYKRGPRDLLQYISDFELVYDEAHDQAGLTINA
eukprot:5203036-Pyramimonas_sp.AAC.1